MAKNMFSADFANKLWTWTFDYFFNHISNSYVSLYIKWSISLNEIY